jgi:hypothetical protein
MTEKVKDAAHYSHKANEKMKEEKPAGETSFSSIEHKKTSQYFPVVKQKTSVLVKKFQGNKREIFGLIDFDRF